MFCPLYLILYVSCINLLYPDKDGISNKYALLQYMFDGPEVHIKVKPHGNSKSDSPFFTTRKTTRQRIQSLAASSTPKSVVQVVTKEEGGELHARGTAFLPRNRQQVSNFRRSTSRTKDDDVLYSIMMECKLSQGKNDLFVQDVKAAPEPQCVLFSDWQLHDLVRFCTDNRRFAPLSVDTTFNLGEFYVTPISFYHLMLEDVRTGKHPVLVGPMLVHQSMHFSTFNYFTSTLVSFNKALRNVLAVGTDGDKNLTEALGHNFPRAIQLRCFVHFKKNVQEKLRDLGIPCSVAKEFLNDIFGSNVGSCRLEGLVDVSSLEDFEVKLANLEDSWNARERPFSSESGPQFYNHFQKYQAKVVRDHMRKDLREVAGLGSPPAIFTTNSSESMNAMLKNEVSFKKTQWSEFVDQMKSLVEEQREEVIRALSGRGRFRLVESYRHLSVSTDEWNKMRSDQRHGILVRFEEAQCSSLQSRSSIGKFATLEPSDLQGAANSTSTLTGHASVSRSQSSTLAISAECSGIHTVPLITLQGIWSKAESLLKGENMITLVPGNEKFARAVISYHSEVPHIVRKKGSSQFVCDSSCVQWQSSHICSHTVAVSNLHGCLQEFIQWYVECCPNPNFTALGMSGMPSGRGKKKNQQTRNVTSSATTDIVMSSQSAQLRPCPPLSLSPQSLPMSLTRQCQPPRLSQSASLSWQCQPTSPHPTYIQPQSQPASLPLQSQPASLPPQSQPASLPPQSQPASLPPQSQPVSLPLQSQPASLPPQSQLASLPPQSQPASLPLQSQPASLPSQRQPASLPPQSQHTLASQPKGHPSCTQTSAVGQALVFVGQSNNFSTPTASCAHSPYCEQAQISISPAQFSVSHNSNPFYLKFISGNIRICQGCRSSLRATDGTIPLPPYNLTIARAERRTFRDTSGNLVTPNKESVSHYHCQVECIKAVEPFFVPQALRVPVDVHSRLQAIHRDYLSEQFGLSL